MAIKLDLDISISPVPAEGLAERNITLSLLRLDQVHPVVSGNKWFKLQEYLKAAKQGAHKGIITFGGAYSNHLAATAAACSYENIPCIGFVRGAEFTEASNETLQTCASLGMNLKFISRTSYKQKDDPAFLLGLQEQYPGYLIVPEGGSGPMGIAGAETITRYIPTGTDTICLAIGSGTTFCGIVNGSQQHQHLVGFPVMKQGGYLAALIAANTNKSNWDLWTEYHFGGFGKYKKELILFMRAFQKQYGILLDHVYTAKMMFGVLDLIAKEDWSDRNILCIHTGGLQGNNSILHLLS